VKGEAKSNALVDTRPALLLVDDDPLISETLSFVLTDEFDVRCAHSGAAAIDSVRDGGPAPSLALVDLGLPPFLHAPDGGFALFEELLALNPAMKVLVRPARVSERTSPTHGPWARLISFRNHVTRPY
jgi:DNA-binding response OmpR family regulator